MSLIKYILASTFAVILMGIIFSTGAMKMFMPHISGFITLILLISITVQLYIKDVFPGFVYRFYGNILMSFAYLLCVFFGINATSSPFHSFLCDISTVTVCFGGLLSVFSLSRNDEIIKELRKDLQHCESIISSRNKSIEDLKSVINSKNKKKNTKKKSS